MLNLDFSEKGMGIVFVYDLSKKIVSRVYILLTEQISFSFLRYWAICILQLFVFQVVKLTLSF